MKSGLLLLILFGSLPSAQGTPLIALREVQNCDGCHKGGRSQKPFLWRRCTLDCQGCHVDPAGAGPRNEWGYYYSHDQMAMVDFIQPIDPLQDKSFFDVHYDARLTQYQGPGGSKTFPMSSEATFRLKPFRKMLSFSYSSLLLGNPSDALFRMVNEGDRRYRERWAVMVDALPLNTYVRYYKGQPMYGLRRPNHTLWIRERIGLGPYATTEATEAGGTPNVPYWRVSQMTGDPYVAEELRQKGTSYHGGFRGVTLGWHINASGWDTSSDSHRIKMSALGAGANIFGLIVYGEKNSRTVDVVEGGTASAGMPTRPHPSSEITEFSVAAAFIPGVMFGSILETYKDDVTESKRNNFFIDLHPIPFLQLELWMRRETGARDFSDTMAIVHLYGDW